MGWADLLVSDLMRHGLVCMVRKMHGKMTISDLILVQLNSRAVRLEAHPHVTEGLLSAPPPPLPVPPAAGANRQSDGGLGIFAHSGIVWGVCSRSSMADEVAAAPERTRPSMDRSLDDMIKANKPQKQPRRVPDSELRLKKGHGGGGGGNNRGGGNHKLVVTDKGGGGIYKRGGWHSRRWLPSLLHPSLVGVSAGLRHTPVEAGDGFD